MTRAPDSWRQGGHSPTTTGQGHKPKDISPVAVAWRYNIGIIIVKKHNKGCTSWSWERVACGPFQPPCIIKLGLASTLGKALTAERSQCVHNSCEPFPGPSSDAHTHSGWPCTYAYMHQVRMVEREVARKKKCTSANTHGKNFLDECLKGVNPSKMTYWPALSFVAWNEDMMARAKAAILDHEVVFAMDAKF